MPRLTLLLCLLLTACGQEPEGGIPEKAWHMDVESPPPEWLSKTGIFDDLKTLEPSASMHIYSPPSPLWSNATDKLRFLYIPDGQQIDTSASDAWVFPVGTVLTKTFTMKKIEARRGTVAIETRVMFRRRSGWEFAVYHWNTEGTEARLLSGNWAEVELRLSDSIGNELPYVIPGRLDCRSCHETQIGAPVIGVHPTNLDPQLSTREIFNVEPTPQALPATSPEEARAMSYFLGNCAFCHHGGNRSNDNASFSLLPADLIANTVNVDTASSASGVGVRVVPGAPDDSALYEAVVLARSGEYEGDFKPMPPVGVVRTDPEASAIISEWIEGL